ncbi:MAG: NnrS family protein [Gammaproteobacteria bacterium]|nr:NnrS family protein [Gammaproteobacteria bacterium]MDH3446631.1 NnrS family protein [Gammaproteobacteria bacterium]
MKSSPPPQPASIEPDPSPQALGYPVIFAYGFRPFFLVTGIYAAVAIPFWIGLLHGLELPQTALPAYVWHAHEMLYGFIAAAVAGFLLTAVPSWTGRRGYAGAPLVGLLLLWVAGRVATTVTLGLPALWIAIIDLAFVPALGLTILPAMLRSGNRRNLVFIGLLALLFASNLHFHLSGAAVTGPLLLGMNTMLCMLAMLGGRIVPAFTSAGLKEGGLDIRIRRYQLLDKMVLPVVGGVLVVDLLLPESLFAAAIAAIAAVLMSTQLGRWQGHRALRNPLVWVLHAGYAWLPVSLAIKALGLTVVTMPGASWLHALTVGAFSTMIMGVMSRAALGHTGRALVAPRGMIAAYLLVTGAALLRVFGPMLLPSALLTWSVLGALLWCLAFLIFLVVYAPILCRARVDGRPG